MDFLYYWEVYYWLFSYGNSSEKITALPESVYKYTDDTKTTLAGFTPEFLANPDAYSEYDTMQIPASVTNIVEAAFLDFENETTSIPNFINNLTFAEGSRCSSIGAGAFLISPLVFVNLPDYLSSIGDSAFYSCTSLTSVSFPNSLTSIGSSAFEECSSIASLTLPSSLTEIGKDIFYNCISLTSVDFSNCSNLTEISDQAFKYCSQLTSVDLSNCSNLTKIIGSAFEYCTSITSVSFPNTLTSFYNDVFRNCSSLNYIAWDLPTNFESVVTINDYAFRDVSTSGKVECLNKLITSQQLLDWLQDKDGGYANPKGSFLITNWTAA